MIRFRSFLRNPFSFLFAGSSKDERLAAYVIREHDRGRALAEILDDPYVRNRCSGEECARILDRPEVVRALGDDIVEAGRSHLATGSSA